MPSASASVRSEVRMVASGTRLGDEESGCDGAGVRMLTVMLMGEGVGMHGEGCVRMRGCGASWCVVFVLFRFFVFGVVRLPSYYSHPLLSVRTPLPSLRIPPFVSLVLSLLSISVRPSLLSIRIPSLHSLRPVLS